MFLSLKKVAIYDVIQINLKQNLTHDTTQPKFVSKYYAQFPSFEERYDPIECIAFAYRTWQTMNHFFKHLCGIQKYIVDMFVARNCASYIVEALEMIRSKLLLIEPVSARY